MKYSLILALTVTVLVTAGCQSHRGPWLGGYHGNNDAMLMVKPVLPDPVTVSATGYGATSNYLRYTDGQRRLMAIRASKLDALRNLAEQVYGVRIHGQSTVSAMMAQNDSFRGHVDAFIRGARVTNVTPLTDGNYETTVELTLGESFYGCAYQPTPCNTSAQYHQLPSPVANGTLLGVVGPGSSY